MKRLLAFLIAGLVIFSLMGCSEDEETTDEFEVLSSYLEDVVGGFNFKVAAPPADSASVAGFLANYELIVDVRESADFSTGHVEGAVNWTYSEFKDNLLTENPTGKVLLICYTGQTAGFLQAVATVLEYDAYILKWGMSGWNSSFDSWSSNTDGSWNGTSDWSEDDAVPAMDTYDAPVLNTGEETGELILDGRIDELLSSPFSAYLITAASVQSTPGDFYIVNYWKTADWETYGHIAGAYNFPPTDANGDLNLTTGNMLFNLPVDQTIVWYCYTGQTSAAAAAYLNILGYDVKSLKFGTNGMIFDDHPVPWHSPAVDLPYVQ